MDHTAMSKRAAHELPIEALAALHSGNTIEAIKIVRAARGLDLKDAKGVVDQYLSAHPLLQRQIASIQAEAGRKLLVAVAVLLACAAGAYLVLHGT